MRVPWWSDLHDREDAKVLSEAFRLRLRHGAEAERLCQFAMDAALADPTRWSAAYRLKRALTLIGVDPAGYGERPGAAPPCG